VITVACPDLSLISGVDVAVLIESVRYGAARAELISGLVAYSGSSHTIAPSNKEPDVKTWFVYDRHGEPLGTTRVASLVDIALQAGEDLPANPLRTFCHDAGAQYCYDVDWTQLVARVQGDASLYLSRPLRIFLHDAVLPADRRAAVFREAFARSPASDASFRVIPFGAEGMLVAEMVPDGVELRWRQASSERWRAQSFGAGEGGAVPPAARLLAAMDLQEDGSPELVLQKTERSMVRGELKQRSDAIFLIGIDPKVQRFSPVTKLTVHEY
jgi:hypothetical protein